MGPTLAYSLYWLAGYVKDPLHFSQSVWNIAPGVVVWPCCFIQALIETSSEAELSQSV